MCVRVVRLRCVCAARAGALAVAFVPCARLAVGAQPRHWRAARRAVVRCAHSVGVRCVVHARCKLRGQRGQARVQGAPALQSAYWVPVQSCTARAGVYTEWARLRRWPHIRGFRKEETEASRAGCKRQRGASSADIG